MKKPPSARRLEVLRANAIKPGEVRNPEGVNQYTYRREFEAVIDRLLAGKPTTQERAAVLRRIAPRFGRGRAGLRAAELALEAVPRNATRAELAAFVHVLAFMLSPGDPILTPRVWPQAPAKIELGGEVKVTVEAREAVARRLDRWLDVVRRDAAAKASA